MWRPPAQLVIVFIVKTNRSCAGSGKVIRGLDIGVGTMLLKEKSRFLIRADYAFGKFGCPPRIPPNATCEYHSTVGTSAASSASVAM